MQIFSFTDDEMLRSHMLKIHDEEIRTAERNMEQAHLAKSKEFFRGRLEAHKNMRDYWQHVLINPKNFKSVTNR